MSFNTPAELQYSKSHEWVRIEGDEAVIGITDYAQDALGDVVYVEIHEVGEQLEADSLFGAVESVKAASDLYSPVAGEIVAVNDAVVNTPELINQDPYGAAWMIKVRLAEGAVNALMSAEAYAAFVDSIKH